MFVKRNLDHPKRAKFVAYIAARHGVSVEHLLDVIKKRKEFRRARMYRKRSRDRVLDNNPKAKKHGFNHTDILAGEGPLHTLLRMMDMSAGEYCDLADTSASTFHGWRGHPMHGLPVAFAKLLYASRKMEAHLRALGVDVAQFQPTLPTEYTWHGRYPRKKGDLDVSSAPLNLDWTAYKK